MAKGVYVNRLVRDSAAEDFIRLLRPNSYVSLESAKSHIAEPEKALLDWIYLCLQTGVTPSLDEIEFKSVDKWKLVKYADKYPRTIRNVLTHSLAFGHFAA